MAARRAARKKPVRRHEARRRLLLAGLVVAATVMIGRTFQLSVIEHRVWLKRAEQQHTDTLTVPAARGTIYDRDGVPLAASREVWMIAVAPYEVSDTDLVVKKVAENTGLSVRDARRYVTGRKWNVLPGRYEEAARLALDGLRGVYFEATDLRFYPHERLGSEVLGHVNAMGDVAGGIEQEMDSLLAGRNGQAVARVDSHSRKIPGAMVRVEEPQPGLDVVLTLDTDLQEIASDALTKALVETGATSGDMIIADPYTGEILAAVSRTHAGASRTWTAVTSPYEPGSTIKPFTVASLLMEQKATLTDSIFGEDGSYRLAGRVIHDVHAFGWLTLRDAFLQSSNIVMAKVASRLTEGEQYQRLRDFGFGLATGIRYPSESGGMLWSPSHWTKQTQASLAFGYEISVTPLQLVMAYGAIANGGVLMEPRLVREIRARNGRVLRRFEPRAIRRAAPQSVAQTMRELLAEVVESGTGRNAAMGTFRVAGKTGTARFSKDGHYLSGEYVATFAGFFPAENPQLVFLVKLDRPKNGSYYGGSTAAPVTRATLEAAMAARGTPLDRSAVATEAAADAPDGVAAAAPAADRDRVRAIPVSLDIGSPVADAPAAEASADGTVAVPPVVGKSLREAVRLLHEAGFHVKVNGSGTVRSTQPRKGQRLRQGRTVTLRASGSGR